MSVSYLCTPVKCTAVSTLYPFFHLCCTIRSWKDSQVGRYSYLNSMLYIITVLALLICSKMHFPILAQLQKHSII